MFIYIPEDTTRSEGSSRTEDSSSSASAPSAEENNDSTLLFEPEDDDENMKNEYDKLKDIASSITSDIVHDYKIPEISNTSHFASTEKFVNDSFKTNDDDDLIAKYLATFNKELKDKKTSDLTSRSPSHFDDSKHDRNDETNAEDHVIADLVPDTPDTPVKADASTENNTQSLQTKEASKRVILVNDSNVELGSGEDNAVKTLLLVKPEDQGDSHDNKGFHTDVYLWHDDPIHAKQRSEKNNITVKEMNNLFDYINKKENSTSAYMNSTSAKPAVQTAPLKPSIHNQVHNLINDLLTLDKSVNNPSLVARNKSINEDTNQDMVSAEESSMLKDASIADNSRQAVVESVNEKNETKDSIADYKAQISDIIASADNSKKPDTSTNDVEGNSPSIEVKPQVNTAADFASTIQKISDSNTAAINALRGVSNKEPVTGANFAPNVLVNPAPSSEPITETSRKKTDTLILFDNDPSKKTENKAVTNNTSVKNRTDDDRVFANCPGVNTNTDDPEDGNIGGRFHTFLGDILLPCQKEISVNDGRNTTPIAHNSSAEVLIKAESLPNNPESNEISEPDDRNEKTNDKFQSMNLNTIVKNKDLHAKQGNINSKSFSNSNEKHKERSDLKHKAKKSSSKHKEKKKVTSKQTHQKSSKKQEKKKNTKKTKAIARHTKTTKVKKIQHFIAEHRPKQPRHNSGKTRAQVHKTKEQHEKQNHAKRVILNHDAEVDNSTNKVLYTIQLSDSDEKKIQQDGNNTVLMISVTGNDKNIMSSNVKVLKKDPNDGSATKVAESNKNVRVGEPGEATLMQQGLSSSDKEYQDYLAQYKKKLTADKSSKSFVKPESAKKVDMAQRVSNSSTISSYPVEDLTEHQMMPISHENATTKTLNGTSDHVKINSTSNIYKLIQLTNDLTASNNAAKSSKGSENSTQKAQSSAAQLKELKELIEQVRNELNVENNALKKLNISTTENDKKQTVNNISKADTNISTKIAKNSTDEQKSFTNENSTLEKSAKLEESEAKTTVTNVAKENTTPKISTVQNDTKLNETKAELIKSLTKTISHIMTNTTALIKPKIVHIEIKSHHPKNTTQTYNKLKQHEVHDKVIHKLTSYHAFNKTRFENALMHHKQQTLKNKSHALDTSLTSIECDHEDNPTLTPDADKENEAKVHAMQWEVFSLVDTKKEEQAKKKKKCHIKKAPKPPKKDIHVIQKNYQKQRGKVNNVLNSFDNHLLSVNDNAHQKFRSNTSNDDIDSDYIGNQVVKMQNDPFDPLPDSNLQKVHYKNHYNNPSTTKESDLPKDNCEGGTCKNNVPNNQFQVAVPDGYDENNQHLLKYLNRYVNKDNLYQTTDKLTHMFNTSHEDVNAALEAADETEKGANTYMNKQPIEVGGHEIDPDMIGMESKGKLITKQPEESEEKKKIASNPGDTEYLEFSDNGKDNQDNVHNIADKKPLAIKEVDHYRDPEPVTPEKVSNFKGQHNDMSVLAHLNKSLEETEDTEPRESYEDTVTAADTINNEQYGGFEKAKEIYEDLEKKDANNLFHQISQNQEVTNDKEGNGYNKEYVDNEERGPQQGAPKVDSVQLHVVDHDVSDTNKTPQNDQVNRNIGPMTSVKGLDELQRSNDLDKGFEYDSSYLQTNPGNTVLETNQQNGVVNNGKVERQNFDRQGDVSVKAIQIDSPSVNQNQFVQEGNGAHAQPDPLVAHSDSIENQRPFTNFEKLDSSVNQIPSDHRSEAHEYVDGNEESTNEENPNSIPHKLNEEVQDKGIEIPLTKDIDEKALEQQHIDLVNNEGDANQNRQSQSDNLVFEPYHEEETIGATNPPAKLQHTQTIDTVKPLEQSPDTSIYGLGTAQTNAENIQTGNVPTVSDGESIYTSNGMKQVTTTENLPVHNTGLLQTVVRKPVLAYNRVDESSHIQTPKTAGEPSIVTHEKDEHGFLKESNPNLITSEQPSYGELGDLAKEKSGLDFLTDDIDQLDREITQSKEGHIKGEVDKYKPSIIDLETTKSSPNVEVVQQNHEQPQYVNQTPPRQATIALQKSPANIPVVRKAPIRKTLANLPVQPKTYTIVKKPVALPLPNIKTQIRPRVINRVATTPARILAKQRPQLPRDSMMRYTSASARPDLSSLSGAVNAQNVEFKPPTQQSTHELTVEPVPSRDAVENEVTSSYPEESNLPDTNEFHPIISVSGTSAPVVHIQ